MYLSSRNKFKPRTSLLNSATFLHTVQELLKERQRDFNKANHIFVRIQFTVIDFGKSRFSDNKSDILKET